MVSSVCLLILFSSLLTLVTAAQRSWLTLNGDVPLVIAKGGYSGLFPDSSSMADRLAVESGLVDKTHIWCDVQLTRDGVGICFPDIRLQNSSNIATTYANRNNTYTVNGISVQGWFSLDFTSKELANVLLMQRTDSRGPYFDNSMPISTIDDVLKDITPAKIWLNTQYDQFFGLHNLSMRSFVISASRRMNISYISSPEVSFLRSITSRFRRGPKLVFEFLGSDDVEPSTNQTYGSLLSNLTLIKTFASGILVPKHYIWHVDSSLYVQNHSSLVLDAHKEGLEVFASGFANDVTLPYNYSYDPVMEYLSFIDNGIFAVDGVLSGFPITPSATIDCFSHMGKTDKVQVNFSIISSGGASGDYPGCTDLAYQKAVSDGVDILDCPVQITNDGIPVCLESINLRESTNAAQSEFINLTKNNRDLKIENGIFVYDLTWSQIQTLTPAISIPYQEYGLLRNPIARNAGNLMQLSEFLALAKNASSVSGVLISIENAAYLAQNQGLDVIDAVLESLQKAGYDNQKTKKIMIKSSHSAVLSKFKISRGNYELVYLIENYISDISNSTILEIKNFASSVVVAKGSVFPYTKAFLTGETYVVPKLHAFDLPVYVQYFQNEFVSQPWDFFSDAYVEISAYVITDIRVDGVITAFPATAARYRRSRCLGYDLIPPYMSPPLPGLLLNLTEMLPSPPNPVLSVNDVLEPPLPPVTKRHPSVNETSVPAPTSGHGQRTLTASAVVLCITHPLVYAALMAW